MSVLKGVKKAIKTKKKTSKLDEYRKKAQGVINRGIKSGYKDVMLEKLGTLDIDVLVKSKKGLEQLKHKMQVIREQTREKEKQKKREKQKLIKNVKALASKQCREVSAEYGQHTLIELSTNKTYKHLTAFRNFDSEMYDENDLRYFEKEMMRMPLKAHAKNYTTRKVEDFFDRYFKTLTLNSKDIPKINELKEHFKNNMVNFNDFASYVTQPNFWGEYDSDNEEVLDPLNHEEHMRYRLDKMIGIAKTGTYKKGSIR